MSIEHPTELTGLVRSDSAEGPEDPSAQARLRRNASVNVFGEALWGLGSLALQPTTVVMSLLRREGAAANTAGLISSMEGGMGLLQLAGPYLFRSIRHRKRLIILWHFLSILPAIYLMGAALAWPGLDGSPRLRRVIVLSGLACFQCSIGVVAAVWMDWFAHLFPERVRGTVSGMVWAATACAGVLGQETASRLIAGNHLVLLALFASCFCTASILLFLLVDDPSSSGPEVVPPRGVELWRRMRGSWSAPGVVPILISRACGGAVFSLAPFITLQFAEQGVSATGIIACGTAMTAGNAVAGLFFGRMGDRLGHRIALRVGLLGALLTLLAALRLTGLPGCALCFALFGLSQGAFLPSMYLLVETTPHDSRLAHLIACNLVLALATILVPFLWAQLAAAQGVGAAELAGLAAGGAGLVVALYWVPEPRHRRAQPPAGTMPGAGSATPPA